MPGHGASTKAFQPLGIVDDVLGERALCPMPGWMKPMENVSQEMLFCLVFWHPIAKFFHFVHSDFKLEHLVTTDTIQTLSNRPGNPVSFG